MLSPVDILSGNYEWDTEIYCILCLRNRTSCQQEIELIKIKQIHQTCYKTIKFEKKKTKKIFVIFHVSQPFFALTN